MDTGTGKILKLHGHRVIPKYSHPSWDHTKLDVVNRAEQLKEFLKCCSLIGVVFPAFQHDFVHFEWAHVWSSQCLAILAFECILNDLLV